MAISLGLALLDLYKTPRIQPTIWAFLRSFGSILGQKKFPRLAFASTLA